MGENKNMKIKILVFVIMGLFIGASFTVAGLNLSKSVETKSTSGNYRLYGYVRLKGSGEPLEGVKISVEKDGPYPSRTDYTDSNGYYELIWDKSVGINMPGTIKKDDYKFLINDPWQFARMGPNGFRVTLVRVQPEVEYIFEAYKGISKEKALNSPLLDFFENNQLLIQLLQRFIRN